MFQTSFWISSFLDSKVCAIFESRVVKYFTNFNCSHFLQKKKVKLLFFSSEFSAISYGGFHPIFEFVISNSQQKKHCKSLIKELFSFYKSKYWIDL